MLQNCVLSLANKTELYKENSCKYAYLANKNSSLLLKKSFLLLFRSWELVARE
jgi:hypothetical protein